MNKHKHLTLDDRIRIQHGLEAGESFRTISLNLGKDPGTISREVKAHIQFKQTGCYGKPYNNCLLRKNCGFQTLCGKIGCKRTCSFCNSYECSTLCKEYIPETCLKLTKPPYVCNGCENRRRCPLEKRLYSASAAQKEYEEIRSEARQGLQISERDAVRLDALISPLLRQGQSLHHICVSHADEIMHNERTLYHYVDKGIFSARNIDMPRVMRMGRRKTRSSFKVDKKCRENRTYLDYRAFMDDNPDLPLVEIDSVEGTKGGKVLLTIHFVVPQYMLAFIREANTSRSVTEVFNMTQEHLTLAMNHVNSYIRKNLGNKAPYKSFTEIYGDDFIKKMGAELIPPDKVIMHPSLLK